MAGALLVGLLAAVGILLIATALLPVPPPLSAALADLRRRPEMLATSRTGASRSQGLFDALGRALAGTSPGRRLGEHRAVDLAITGTSLGEHLARRLLFAASGLLVVPTAAAVLAAIGVGIGVAVPLWACVVAATTGWMWPSVSLRSAAAARRRSLRHGLSAFLDVVSIALAGGRGVESALHDGAEAGHGWAFEELRGVLLEARLLGETPWAALSRAAEVLGVSELAETAASAALAGDEGARVRSSLAAKARSLRLRGLSEIEAAAHSASELMSLPVVILMFGFIVFLGYPAIVRIVHGI